jgi:tight adherence protein B
MTVRRPWVTRSAGSLLGALLLGVLSLGLLPTAPVSAADERATIDHALPSKGKVRLLVTVPGTDAVDYAGVEVTIGGKSVPSSTLAASSSATVQRTSVLAIDTSASMRGARIAEAKKAAATYLGSVPANVQVGVVTFDDTVKVLVPPTLDRAAARSAVAGLTLTLNTALYDGVLGALQAAGPGGTKAGQRKILVLSDGKDTTATPLEKVTDAIRESGATVDVVSIQNGDTANAPLTAMAEAGKGSVYTTANPAALTAAFGREALALSRQVVVTANLPAGFTKTSSDVLVTVPTTGRTYTASAYVPVRSRAEIDAEKPALAAPQVVQPGAFALSPRIVFGAVGAIGVGLLGIIAGLAIGTRSTTSDSALNAQIRAYGMNATTPGSGPRPNAQPALGDQARQAAEKALANNKNLEAKISKRLDAAGLALRPSEWLLLRAAITIGGGMVGALIGAGNLIIGVLCFLAAAIGPSIYLKVKRAKRLRAFSTGLADTLQLMSGSLSAGLSLAQSIDTIVKEGAEPISGEFRRVVVESRLGVTLEDSLEGVAERMESRDFTWVVMAIRIQREVGGNLAELLLTVAATLREREYLRRHVKALSAEGRLSCYILGGLPPGFLLYLSLSKPDYVHPMYTTPIGWILCTAITVLLGVGVLWMSKLAKVDV